MYFSWTVSSLLMVNENEPIFQGYIPPDQSEFLVMFYKPLQDLRQTDEIRNASF